MTRPRDERRDETHDTLHDAEIRRALAHLPRERAGEGFTEQVLRRLDEDPTPERSPWKPFRHSLRQPALAGAAVGLVLVAALVAVGVLRPGTDGAGSESSGPVVAHTDGPTGEAAHRSATGSPATRSTPPRTAPQEGSKEASASEPQGPEAAALLDELRREHTRLKRDLRSLRELAEGSRVIYVGGDESLDFVLELSPEETAQPGTDVRPARLREPGAGGGPSFF